MIEEKGAAWTCFFALASVARRGMRRLEASRGLGRKLRGGQARVLDYVLTTDDAELVRGLYSDIFVGRIYHFEAERDDPLIVDCGSNIGMSILYFKSIFPQARIISFEPDPLLFSSLQRTVSDNALSGVRLVNAALADREDPLTFYSDGKVRGCLLPYVSDAAKRLWSKYQVPCVRLRDFIAEPVDFLKMDIEGAEWDVLADSEDLLHLVREIVLEVHLLPGREELLNEILRLLDRQGFACYVTGYLRPPLRLADEKCWTQQIYAQRI